MANDNPYAIRELIVRETPLLGQGGRTVLITTVSYMVGAHGPFIKTYEGAVPNAAQVAQDVTAKVNELRALDRALDSLNQQTRT